MPDNRTNLKSTIMPTLCYRNAPAAIDWFCQVFGFEKHAVYPGPENTIGHAAMGGIALTATAANLPDIVRMR